MNPLDSNAQTQIVQQFRAQMNKIPFDGPTIDFTTVGVFLRWLLINDLPDPDLHDADEPNDVIVECIPALPPASAWSPDSPGWHYIWCDNVIYHSSIDYSDEELHDLLNRVPTYSAYFSPND
ncbi:MAG: hypothetical protein LCH85_22055 [Chloroflexi bacterium]|nr:hypothetical protein [Chloroflexota bacterium]